LLDILAGGGNNGVDNENDDGLVLGHDEVLVVVLRVWLVPSANIG
jgi:hypothetical protein